MSFADLNKRKLFFSIIIGFILFFCMNRMVELYRLAPNDNFFIKFVTLFQEFGYILKNPLHISLHLSDLKISGAFALIVFFYLVFKSKEKTRTDEEYGSAEWGKPKDIKSFIDPIFKNNIILADGIYKTLNNQPKDPKLSRNNNVMIVGGSGSGKTYFYVTPNILQMHTSYFITDPKGTLVDKYGSLLKKNGYEIKVFNTTNFQKSMRYNPFVYIKSERDILEFVEALIANTNGDKKATGDPFWESAEKLLYYAYIGYIISELPPDKHNFSTLLWMVNNSKPSIDENDDTFKNEVDLIFEALRDSKPDCFAVRQYEKFKLADAKVAKGILISTGARLAPFDIEEIRELTLVDELELDTYGDKKVACFMIISDTSRTFNFLVALIESQFFTCLINKADDKYGGRLPIHVRCILDEFANIGKIPNFHNIISVIRSREISTSIILQAEAQLASVYGKADAPIISANCDSYIFLGTKEKTTLKEVCETLGKETIRTHNKSLTKGQRKSLSHSDQGIGRELMSVDELNRMSREECIVMVSGVKPFKVKKYNPKKHPTYKKS